MSWQEMLEEARSEAGDTTPIVGCTLTAEEMSTAFDTGYSSSPVGQPFTA